MDFLNKKAAVVIGCFIILSLAFIAPPSMRGDEWNQATRFSISHQFEVPNMVLQPNTPYVIRILDSPSNRDVVQIYNDDQTKMLTMFMTIASERLEPFDETTFSFIETEPGYPLPVKEWFYPGRLRGREFVYPKDQAMKIAQHAREPILATGSTNLHDLASIEVEAIGPVGTRQDTTVATAAVTKSEETTDVLAEKPSEESVVAENNAAEPALDQENVAEQENLEDFGAQEQAPVEIAQNTEDSSLKADTEILQEKPSEEPAVSEQAPVDTDQDRELPATAGELPLIALIGVLCLGAGFGFKVLSARS